MPLKLNRIRVLEPAPVVECFKNDTPGDQLHLDIKKLGRIVRPSHLVIVDRRNSVSGTGWEYVHGGIDDHSRIACLGSTLDGYSRLGIRCKAILADDSPANRSLQFAHASLELGLKHRFTLSCPYTPHTNGKDEPFIQTALLEWAYAYTYQNSEPRSHQIRSWLHIYNCHRTHASLNKRSPFSRSDIDRTNLLSNHSVRIFPSIESTALPVSLQALNEDRFVFIFNFHAAATFRRVDCHIG